jgi:pimeloyl-ACP methyl ester carboxylesterase
MVFLHPLPADRSAWLYQQAHFSTWCRTLAIDLPGYGQSPASGATLSVADIAEACWDAVDATSPEPAILVGLSMGSTVAQFMAASRPGRTLALVLTGGGWFPATDARFHGNIEAAIDHFEREGITAREHELRRNYGPRFAGTPLADYLTTIWTERNSQADTATIVQTYRALRTAVPDDLHARIKSPTLVITGSADPATEAHRRLAERIANSELRTIEGAGHLCNAERPWEYDALVLEFLRTRGILER